MQVCFCSDVAHALPVNPTGLAKDHTLSAAFLLLQLASLVMVRTPTLVNAQNAAMDLSILASNLLAQRVLQSLMPTLLEMDSAAFQAMALALQLEQRALLTVCLGMHWCPSWLAALW
jgi:hypothetical protein